LISLISINSATSLFTHLFGNRVEKKVKKSKTRTKDGSGSWDSGFDCPEIQVAKGNGELKNEGTGIFYPKRLDQPVTQAEKLGWCFKMEKAPAGNLKEIMLQDGSTNNWCLQFRYMTSSFSYTNPTGNKYIEGWFTNDFGQAFRFRVLLPWKLIGWYIDDDEGKKICSFLNKYRTTANNAVLASKSSVKTECAKYMANKPLFDQSNGKAADLSKQSDELKAKLEVLKKSLQETQTQFDTAKKEADSFNAQAQEAQTKLKAAQEAENGQSSQLTQIKNTLQTTLSTGTANVSDTNKLKAEVDTNLSKFNSELDILTAEAPQRPVEIKAARAANEKLDSGAVTKSLSGIYS